MHPVLRGANALLGAAVVALVVWVVVRENRIPRIDDGSAARKGASTKGGPVERAGGSPAARADTTSADGGALFVGDLGSTVGEGRSDAERQASVLPDGTPVPPLPLSAPRQLRFGVVLVAYVGVQPPTAPSPDWHAPVRSKADAKVLAEKLAETAQQDFHAAVQQGDSGSADDIGRVKVGILEPAPEYILFTLPVDGVAGPVDTPRGYWIVKRLE